jgi:hypothetical protein
MPLSTHWVRCSDALSLRTVAATLTGGAVGAEGITGLLMLTISNAALRRIELQTQHQSTRPIAAQRCS